MTRKRYTKLLMAQGWSRNSANELAEYARKKGISYQAAIDKFPFSPERIAELSTQLCDSLHSIGDALKRFVDAFSAGLGAFVEKFNNEFYGGYKNA